MGYQWNRNKTRSNRRKHSVSSVDAVTVFMDDLAIIIEDEHPDEDRFVIIGKDALGRVLVVVFTYRGDDVRIISARKANSLERQEYEEWS